ncbi:MAG: hypothetical protein NVSMB64_30500 [Candidatus Velthaea sp.]
MNARVLFLLGAFSLSACGAGGGSAVPRLGTQAPSNASAADATPATMTAPSENSESEATGFASVATTFNVSVPTNATAAHSVTVSFNGGAATVVNLGPTTAGCHTGSGTIAYVCTAHPAAPSGTDTLAFATHSLTGGGGTVLATALATRSIASGSVINAVLGGAAAKAVVTLQNAAATGCGGGALTENVFVSASDSLGNIIIGAYAHPLTLTDSDHSGATTLSPSSVATSTTAITLKYSGAALSSAQIGVSATGLTSVTPATFTSGGKLIYAANTSFPPSITSYPANASGNVAPTRKISGAATQLVSPAGIAHDSACNLYVVDQATNAIYKYAAGATGNVAPMAVIKGSATTINGAIDIAVDASGYVYVANGNAYDVLVFAPGANGNVAPARTLDTSSFGGPYGVAVDSGGRLHVVFDSSTVAVYGPGARGSSAPVAVITGANTQLVGSVVVKVDAAGKTYVSSYQGYTLVFAAGANGNVAPVAKVTPTNAYKTYGIAVDASGALYTSISKDFNRSAGAAIFSYPPGANGSPAPRTFIEGSATGLSQNYISI